ncbi:hypothetical protein FFI87_021350 [Burkholderia sp. KBS0801]|nr:hypothetical protein FFI87_021350 [Burkholderia sp. KBS0801]
MLLRRSSRWPRRATAPRHRNCKGCAAGGATMSGNIRNPFGVRTADCRSTRAVRPCLPDVPERMHLEHMSVRFRSTARHCATSCSEFEASFVNRAHAPYVAAQPSSASICANNQGASPMKSMNAIQIRVACVAALLACATGFGHAAQSPRFSDAMTEVETDLVTPLERISTDGRLVCTIAGNADSKDRRTVMEPSSPSRVASSRRPKRVVTRRQEPLHHSPCYPTSVDDAKDWT